MANGVTQGVFEMRKSWFTAMLVGVGVGAGASALCAIAVAIVMLASAQA